MKDSNIKNTILNESKHSFMHVLFLGGIILIIALLIVEMRMSEFKEGQENLKKTVQTSGFAEMNSIPTQAVIYASIQTAGKNAKDAQKKNAELTNLVFEELKKLQIADTQVASVNYQVYENKEYNPVTQKTESKGYLASHQLKITLLDISKVGEILDDIVNAGVTNIDSVSFVLSDEQQKEIHAKLIAQASLDAKEKATILAQALDVKIRKPISITESYGQLPMYSGAYANKVMSDSSELMPQQVKTSTTVNVVFGID